MRSRISCSADALAVLVRGNGSTTWAIVADWIGAKVDGV